MGCSNAVYLDRAFRKSLSFWYSEYFASGTLVQGEGVWGEPLTVVADLNLTSAAVIVPNKVNLLSFNADVGNNTMDDVFMGMESVVCRNDNGNFYSTVFGIDDIGSIDQAEGYQAFTFGTSGSVIYLDGDAADVNQVVELDPMKYNFMGYLPSSCMMTGDVFDGYEDDLLVVKDDSGNFYAPGFGIMTLTEMCPGKSFSVWQTGSETIDFTYPADGLARTNQAEIDQWEDFKLQSASEHYDVVETGLFHPIVITSLTGEVEVGDELAAYANGQLVGATRVVDPSMVVLSAWEAVHGADFGVDIDLPGYELGDRIELRLWSASQGRELHVSADLNGNAYGTTPLTSGTASVMNASAVPTQTVLMQNYPNPFNPVTTIGFSLEAAGNVTLKVYDLSGREVATLVDGHMDQGSHNVGWNGRDAMNKPVSAGLYIYAMTSGSSTITKKMVLMK